MRFTLVSVALLALANSLAVQGYPALEETNSLVDRQAQSLVSVSLGDDISSIVTTLQNLLNSLVRNLLIVPPATPDPTSSAPPTRFSPTTTTSFGPAAATGASSLATSHPPSVSGVPEASSSHPSRMRRQAASSHPSSVLSSGLSKLGSATPKLGTSSPTSSHPDVSPTRV